MFGEVLFADTPFADEGGSGIYAGPIWKGPCPDDSEWDDTQEAEPSWTGAGISLPGWGNTLPATGAWQDKSAAESDWDDKRQSRIPTGDCTKTEE